MRKAKLGKKSIIAMAGAGAILLLALGGVILLPKILNKGGEALHVNLQSDLDCTDAAADALADITGTSYRFDGEVYAHFYMSLDDGEFTMTLDEDQLKEDLDLFFTDNVEGILSNQLSAAGQATDAESLNAYAASIGYADWSAVVDATAASVMDMAQYEELTDGEIAYEGTYEYTEDGAGLNYFVGSKQVFSAEIGDNGEVYVDFDFDRNSPVMLYDYFNRGCTLEFVKASGNGNKPSSDSDDDDRNTSSSGEGIVVNVYIETVPTETEPVPTETEPEPTPTPEPTPVPETTMPVETEAPAETAPVETEAPAETAEAVPEEG